MLLNVTFEYVADGSAEREISEEEENPLMPSSTLFLFQMLLTSAQLR